jgi:hypothetical protein
MIQNYFDNVKRVLGSLISNAHVRKRWAGFNPRNSLDFVQKRFERCLVIAKEKNLI